MPTIDHAIMQGFLDVGLSAQTTAEQGKALEDLICYLFGLVPGIVVTHRNEKNSFGTEEIDVALYNDDDRGAFRSLPNIILIECKNWSHRVGSSEVAWFITKLRSRGLDFGILISTLGITGDTQDLTAAHHLVAMELADKRKLIVLTTHELESLVDTDQLALLIKTKLCELAVKGSIV